MAPVSTRRNEDTAKDIRQSSRLRFRWRRSKAVNEVGSDTGFQSSLSVEEKAVEQLAEVFLDGRARNERSGEGARGRTGSADRAVGCGARLAKSFCILDAILKTSVTSSEHSRGHLSGPAEQLGQLGDQPQEAQANIAVSTNAMLEIGRASCRERVYVLV